MPQSPSSWSPLNRACISQCAIASIVLASCSELVPDASSGATMCASCLGRHALSPERVSSSGLIFDPYARFPPTRFDLGRIAQSTRASVPLLASSAESSRVHIEPRWRVESSRKPRRIWHSKGLPRCLRVLCSWEHSWCVLVSLDATGLSHGVLHSMCLPAEEIGLCTFSKRNDAGCMRSSPSAMQSV